MAQQADDAYSQGESLYQQGRFIEALAAFKRARLLSPTDDPRVDDMIQRISVELTPSPTPAPPTPTPLPEPTPVMPSTASPASDLGNEYFGQVFLSVIPGRDGTAAPMATFSNQDQIGLYIERLEQRLRLSFDVRIFEADSGRLIRDSRSDAVRRIQDRFVWYHEGSEAPGNYRLELYADGSGEMLTHVFEYVVGTTPVALPTPVVLASPTFSPTFLPVVMAPPTVAPAAAPPVIDRAPVALAPTPVPQPPPPRVATPTPVTATATTMNVTAGPAAVDFVEVMDELFVADRSGRIWGLQHGEPALAAPFSVPGEPVGLVGDPAAQRLYVAVRTQPQIVVLDATSGNTVATAPLPGNPGDIRLDPSLGFLYVVLPERDALQVIDTRDVLKTVTISPELPQVTGIALDETEHVVYVSHLGGEVSVLDGKTGRVTNRLRVSGPGLAGIAVANGRISAVNAPEKTLWQVDLSHGEVSQIQLPVEPASVVIGPQSGAVYMVDVDSNALLKLDPFGASELARASLGGTARAVASDLAPETVWLRPRMSVSQDEHVYVIEPEAATLAIVPAGF